MNFLLVCCRYQDISIALLMSWYLKPRHTISMPEDQFENFRKLDMGHETPSNLAFSMPSLNNQIFTFPRICEVQGALYWPQLFYQLKQDDLLLFKTKFDWLRWYSNFLSRFFSNLLCFVWCKNSINKGLFVVHFSEFLPLWQKRPSINLRDWTTGVRQTGELSTLCLHFQWGYG